MNHIVHGRQKFHQVNIVTNFIATYNVARMLVEEHVPCMQLMIVAILYHLILGDGHVNFIIVALCQIQLLIQIENLSVMNNHMMSIKNGSAFHLVSALLPV